jgi:uncharacterized protein
MESHDMAGAAADPGAAADAGAAGGPGAAEDPLVLLLEVQDRDLALDRLRYRLTHLPERAALATATSSLATLDRTISASEGSLGELVSSQASLERDIESANARIHAIEERLYHGEGVAYRDQQAMADEVKHLEQRRAGFEDQEIDLMESMEPLEAQLGEMRGRRAALAAESATLTTTIATTSRQIEAEAAQVRAERDKLAPGLPADLSATYEQLRARLGGIGAARLEHGSCSGCHLTLPSTELDRIRRRAPGEAFTCDQCGRILVP